MRKYVEIEGYKIDCVTKKEVKRAPLWMQDMGLEWFHRMIQEPSRLYKRYLLHDIPFVFAIFGRALRKRLAIGK